MSRHRFVRGMDFTSAQEEFEALSDGGEDENDEITPEQFAQMRSVREHVRAVIGAPRASGITDKEIDDASWEFYFDLDQTMDYILEIKNKRDAAKERQEPDAASPTSTETTTTLSKLQKLSLAKKAEQKAPPKSLASLAKSAQTQSKLSVLASKSPGVTSPTDSATRAPSKLSLLAAQAKASKSPTSPPLSAGLSSPPAASKLAQKIAASRIAPSPATTLPPPNTPPTWSLAYSQSTAPVKASKPSSFGSVLISISGESAPRSIPAALTGNLWSSEFKFDSPSPDDIILHARRGTSLATHPAKERERQEKLAGMSNTNTPRAGTPTKIKSPKKGGKAGPSVLSGSSTPIMPKMDQMDTDMLALNLQDAVGTSEPKVVEEPPKITLAKEKVLEEAKKAVSGQGGVKPSLSIVIIGHVDAGKSTLVGRLLYELGRIESKKRAQTDRASEKSGKSSFTWAWEMDSGEEERNRGITIDIAQIVLPLEHKELVILDAPGHKDFVPNMITGASQADCALLVVDATTGEFEAGFDKGGQTREHLLLVRSLGVQQLVVAVNKLDMVEWSEARFLEIQETLSAFLIQSGFHSSKTVFVPVAGFLGVNLLDRAMPQASELSKWYSGPTLVQYLDKLEPPGRAIDAPLRFPVTNVFRGQSATSSGFAVAGRLCSGVVQVGERLRIVPGDETALVKMIEADGESLPWAAAGSAVNLYLSGIDPIHLSIGTVLCPPSAIVPLATSFVAQIIIFDIRIPITIGTSVELFHHAQNIPATIQPLEVLDRLTSAVIKNNPRVLTKGMSAKVRINLRGSTISDSSGNVTATKLPIETFKENKDMGRVLLRRNGETIAAGIVLSLDG